uniref:Protein kinase domain-containing protein n=1 Tax=Globodera pallida TaxID=36090 RepID=A0A183CF49_GLOPA
MNAEESSQSEPKFLGRTLSASAADFERKRKGAAEIATSVPAQTNLFQFSFGNDHQSPVRHSIIGLKRKYSSQEYSSSSSPIKQQSRPNSPSNAGSRLILPRGRLASIRRESDCSSEKKFVETEAAHEKLVKSAQQVAMGFEDFCLDDKLFEERKRAKSLTEPISIFTSAFLPQSSSPSPSRGCVDGQKQCYSPSAQQVVRSNLAYSPSPSPTPASSPSMHRMRSMSPIAVRQIAKRRYTGSSNGNGGNGNVSGLESDGEGSFSHSTPAPKRQCTTPKNNSNSSPLVRDPSTNLLPQQSPLLSSSSSSSMADFFSASNPSYSAVSNLSARFGPLHSARFLVDPNLTQQEEENMGEEEDEPRDNPLMSSFCSSTMFIDANSSTTFSSRANTPESSQTIPLRRSFLRLHHIRPVHPMGHRRTVQPLSF